jgi:hypothetical protein
MRDMATVALGLSLPPAPKPSSDRDHDDQAGQNDRRPGQQLDGHQATPRFAHPVIVGVSTSELSSKRRAIPRAATSTEPIPAHP